MRAQAIGASIYMYGLCYRPHPISQGQDAVIGRADDGSLHILCIMRLSQKKVLQKMEPNRNHGGFDFVSFPFI